MAESNTTIRGVADMARVHARTRPSALAVAFCDRRTTYAELDERSNRIANGLLAAGATPESRIAYVGKNSDVYFELLLGAAKARCAMVPLNWRLAPPEIAFILQDAAPVLVVAEPEFEPAVRHHLGSLATLYVGGPTDADYRSWRDGQDATDPALEVVPDDNVVVMYTSGTTGLPKGAQLTNANVMAHLSFIDAGSFGSWDEQDIQLICLPIFHIGGTDSGLWSFYTGGMVLLLPDASPVTIIEAFARWAVTIAGFVPTIMRSVLEHPDAGALDFAALKLVSYGGSPIAPDLMAQARKTFGCRFQQLFGMTETTGGVVILKDEDHLSDDPVRFRSCGRPLPGCEVVIVDPEGQQLDVGAPGEIAVRGATVTKGYWQRPDESVKALRDGWFMTGDVGYFDTDGYLFIHDRIKDMIVSGGENVYPTEVENALALHEAIAETAVIGVPDARWGETVKAFVVLREGHAPDATALIAFTRTRLAAFKCPKSIDFVDALPRNASGKVLRRELRKPFWGESGRQVG